MVKSRTFIPIGRCLDQWMLYSAHNLDLGHHNWKTASKDNFEEERLAGDADLDWDPPFLSIWILLHQLKARKVLSNRLNMHVFPLNHK
jgi:hypothetical protein